MEGVAAFGLVFNILQVVDFSTKLIYGSKELYQSGCGMREEDRSLDSVVKEMQQLTLKLEPHPNTKPSEDEKVLGRLAAECRIVSDQILDLLQRVAPDDPKSRRHTVLSTAKSMWSDRDKRGLQTRLDNCRSQLGLQLDYMNSEENRRNFAFLANKSNTTIGMLVELHRKTDSLRDGIKISSLSDEAQMQFRGLLDTLRMATDATKQVHIRKSLAFSEIRGRFNAVSKADINTFHWLVDGSRSDKSPGTSDAYQLFSDWLLNGDGIFHISGKLGSGKSTLMKFLAGNAITLRKLDQWAGNKKLVFGSFFFWRPGSALQKSLSGLKRSLLHDILKECPELTPDLFQEHWSRLSGAESNDMDDVQIKDEDIRVAFKQLTTHQNLGGSRRFCFFIDGLDEYMGTPQEDYGFMVKELKKWTQCSNQSVKLCVSSREYPVFENEFLSEKRLRLQDLTSSDMTRYTEDRLEELEDKAVKEKIVRMVVEHSDGIFLWVALVVKRLRDCMDVDRSLGALEGELRGLPRELEDLFIHLLESLPEAHPQIAYQAFAIMDFLGPEDKTLLAFSFLDDYQANKSFAMARDFLYERIDANALEKHLIQAQGKLKRYTQGLLETETIKWPTTHDTGLRYLHRSVPEFLQKHQNSIKQHLNEFSVCDAIFQIFLAEIRVVQVLPGHKGDMLYWLLPQLHPMLINRMKERLDTQPFEFLEYLNGVILERTTPERHTLQQEAMAFQIQIPTMNGGFFLVYVCAFLGYFEYVTWKLDQSPQIHESAFICFALLLSLSAGLEVGQRVIVRVHERFALMGRILKTMANIHHTNAGGKSTSRRDGLFVTLLFAHILKKMVRLTDCSMVQELGSLFEHMLKLDGFDPRLRWVLELEETRRVRIQSQTVQSTQFDIESKRPVILRDLVNFWKSEGKETILALIERRTRILDIADTYVEAFWKITAEEGLLNTHSEPSVEARAVISVAHKDTANGNEAQDGRTQDEESCSTEDRDRLIKELHELIREVQYMGQDFRHEHFRKESMYLKYPNIMAKLGRQRKKIIDTATAQAENESWAFDDKAVLLTWIDIAIVRDIEIMSLPWSRATFHFSIIVFLLDLLDQLDLVSTDEPEETIDQSPAIDAIATPTTMTEQTSNLKSSEQPARLPATTDFAEETKVCRKLNVHEHEQQPLATTPASPILSRRPVPIRRWQEQILFLILGVLVAKVLPSIWAAIFG